MFAGWASFRKGKRLESDGGVFWLVDLGGRQVEIPLFDDG